MRASSGVWFNLGLILVSVSRLAFGQSSGGATQAPAASGSAQTTGVRAEATRLMEDAETKLTKLAEAPIGHWSQGVAFTPNNQYVLVQNMVEKDIMIFKLAGDKLEDTGQRLQMKGGPAALRTAEKPL